MWHKHAIIYRVKQIINISRLRFLRIIYIINGKCKYKSYEEDDNDLYWLNCKNGKFYVIPEDALFVNGYIGKDCKKQKLYVSQTNENTEWCNAYLFDYNNVDKEKLLKIIQK